VNLTYPILAYRVEAFTKGVAASVLSSSFFGESEVQLVSTRANSVTGGSFTLAFDEFSVLLPARVTGEVKIQTGGTPSRKSTRS
jgi:hypothetical protein